MLLLNTAACSNGLITKLLASVAMGITWGEMEISKGSSGNLGANGQWKRGPSCPQHPHFCESQPGSGLLVLSEVPECFVLEILV